MKRTIVYKPYLGEVALAILLDAGKSLIKGFFPHPYFHTYCESCPEVSFRRSLERLRRKKHIHARKGKYGLEYTLTKEGQKLAKKVKFRLEFSKNKKWDGKWRIIIFDIPEKVRGK